MKLSLPLAALAACTVLMPLMTSAARAQAPVLDLPAPTKSDETTDSFVWTMQPAVGSRWQMRSFTRTESAQITPGPNASQTESVVLQRMVADYDVLSRDRFGGTTSRITFRDMDVDVSLKVNGEMVKVPDVNTPRLKRAINGASFTVKQGPNGAIWNMMGVEAMQKRLLNALSGDDMVLRRQMQTMSESLFSPDGARKMMAQSGVLPAYPIRVGESWAYAVEPPAGLPLNFKMAGERTINLLTPDFAFVSDNAIYNGGQGAPAATGGAISFDMSNIEGGLLGTSRVERESGLTLESTLSQRLQGAMIVRQTNAAGRVQSAQNVPLDIVTTGRVVLEPR